jgi:hypothetical protein
MWKLQYGENKIPLNPPLGKGDLKDLKKGTVSPLQKGIFTPPFEKGGPGGI